MVIARALNDRVRVQVEFEFEFELIRCTLGKGQALQTFTMWSDYGKLFSSGIMLKLGSAWAGILAFILLNYHRIYFVCPYVCLSLSSCLSVNLSVCIYIFIYLFNWYLCLFYLCFYLFIYMFIYSFIHCIFVLVIQ